MMILTVDALRKATGANQANAELYLPYIQGTCKAYSITSPKRLAGFLSQIGHESAGLSTIVENLNYSSDALINMFGRHRISVANARKFGRSTSHRADQQNIANSIYGGEWGRANLGNTQWGDGWNYRGRGLKQLTGRHNYTECGDAIGEDLDNRPDRLLMPVNAALSAGWFWSTRGLNKLADYGDVVAMTKVINGGVNGLAERIELYQCALAVCT